MDTQPPRYSTKQHCKRAVKLSLTYVSVPQGYCQRRHGWDSNPWLPAYQATVLPTWPSNRHTADELAKVGISFVKIEIMADQELKEECDKVDSFIIKEWQHNYDLSLTGHFYRQIEPEVMQK